MNREKLNKLSQNLLSDRDEYITAFRKNLDMYIADDDFTIRQIAEESDIPFSTLNSFLYGNAKDCKLSTAVKLARALNVSIDELVGCETLSDSERWALIQARNMPNKTRYLLKWFIDFQSSCIKKEERARIISVMIPRFQEGQGMYPTNQFERLDISHYSDEVKAKVYMGIRVLCGYYMPIYTPYDTLLIANDRVGSHTENCVVIFYGKICIVKRVVDQGIVKYIGVQDGRFLATEEEIDNVIGYIVDIHDNDTKET